MKSKCDKEGAAKVDNLGACTNAFSNTDAVNDLLTYYKGIERVEKPLRVIIDNDYEVVQVDRFREPHYGNGTLVEKLTIHYRDEFNSEYELKIILN